MGALSSDEECLPGWWIEALFEGDGDPMLHTMVWWYPACKIRPQFALSGQPGLGGGVTTGVSPRRAGRLEPETPMWQENTITSVIVEWSARSDTTLGNQGIKGDSVGRTQPAYLLVEIPRGISSFPYRSGSLKISTNISCCLVVIEMG